jgi:hypothetical protein
MMGVLPGIKKVPANSSLATNRYDEEGNIKWVRIY